MPHPHKNFNKQPHDAPTLVGNWQEERSLKDATGITRYEVGDSVNVNVGGKAQARTSASIGRMPGAEGGRRIVSLHVCHVCMARPKWSRAYALAGTRLKGYLPCLYCISIPHAHITCGMDAIACQTQCATREMHKRSR